MNVPDGPLPPHLEKLWKEMQQLKRHPLFEESFDCLDKRFAQAYINLMYIPKIWLADGRERQVRAAMRAIKKAIKKLEASKNPSA